MALLLCSQWVMSLATQASASAQSRILKVASLKFYYRVDENARFLDLKTQWQTEHKGQFSIDKAAELADLAYQQASVDSELTQWRYQGGPAPQKFLARLHLYNSSRQAILNTPISVRLKAKVGDLRVSPATQLTDYAHLGNTSRWETIFTQKINIPAIAPEEDQIVDVMPFNLLSFLARHPNQWPSELKVTVYSPQMGQSEKILTLMPDHFVVPILY